MAVMTLPLFGGFDIGTRNSAAAYIDGKGRLKHLSFQGGGVHTSNLPFVRTAVQMLDATVKQLHDDGLIYCSLANAKAKVRPRGFVRSLARPLRPLLLAARPHDPHTHEHTPSPSNRRASTARSGTGSSTGL